MRKRKNFGRRPGREAEKVKMLSSQYEQLQRAWSENAMLFHDMENHLQTIYHMAQAGKNQEIARYISRISRPVEQLSGIWWTGVGIVDAVLNAKKQLAEEKGFLMEINAQLPANTGISDDDFCTVLANLLDNAIESLERDRPFIAGEKRPVIHVSLRRINHFLVICILNPCREEAAKGRGFYGTAKGDGLRHGWGLKSVRRVVRKYHGSLSLSAEDGQFVAAAMLFFTGVQY